MDTETQIGDAPEAEAPDDQAGPAPAVEPPATDRTLDRPTRILVIDIGGTKVKMLAPGQAEPQKTPSGPEFTPGRLVEAASDLSGDCEYDAVSIGIPCVVGDHGPRSEPGNLGPGWVGFDYAGAFGKPVRLINDAAMQALGSYDGGRMLFLGLGTGLGSALIAEKVILPLELGRLRYADSTLGLLVGRAGLEKLGKSKWRKLVAEAATALMDAFQPDYVVLGGGNAKLLKELPNGMRLGHNRTAFRGGIRLWNVDDMVTHEAGGESDSPAPPPADWRLI